MKLTATVLNNYDVKWTYNKEGKPVIHLEDFCEVLDYTLADAFDFYEYLGKDAGSLWPEIGKITEIKEDKYINYYITVPQAYALISQIDEQDRIKAAEYLLLHDLPKAMSL